MNHFGATIYALRKSRYLTQEQLAEKLSDFELGIKLLAYCNLARRQGYLALEPAILKDKPDAFLEFAITFVLDTLRKGMGPEQITEYLKNYAAAEPDWQSKRSRCNMMIDVLMAILSGENPEVLRELIASYLGKDLRSKFMRNEDSKISREEILDCYQAKVYKVNLLEELAATDDAILRTVIRNIDNVTLATALSGASGAICIRFLRNLSDRLLYFLHEDIQTVRAGDKEVREAQRLVLELVKQH